NVADSERAVARKAVPADDTAASRKRPRPQPAGADRRRRNRRPRRAVAGGGPRAHGQRRPPGGRPPRRGGRRPAPPPPPRPPPPAAGSPRRPSFGLIRGLGLAAVAPAACTRILRRVRPDVVFGGGGYVAGPMLAAAAGLRIPAALMEVDAHLGLANRMAAPFARRGVLAFPVRGPRPPPHPRPPPASAPAR